MRNVWIKTKEWLTPRKIMGVKIEKEEVIISRDSEPSAIINSFEKIIRYFIVEELKSVFSDKWLKQGVPKEVRTNWLERKAEDDKVGRLPVGNLINYADFSDYKEIILRNWGNIFFKFFRDKEQTRVRFDDLNNFRKAVMHSRVLSDDEIGHAKVTIRWIKTRLASVGEGWAEKIIAFKRTEEKEKGYIFGWTLSEKIGDRLGYLKILEMVKVMQDKIGMPVYGEENASERYIAAFVDSLDDLGANVMIHRKEWFTGDSEWTENDYEKEQEKFEENARKEGSLAWIMKLASCEKDFPVFECSDEFLGEMFRAIHTFYMNKGEIKNKVVGETTLRENKKI